MRTDIIDMFVNLVSDYDHLWMFSQYCRQSGQFFFCIYRTCRIRRRTKNQCFRLRSDGCFQLFWSNLEILFDTCRNNYRSTFCHFHHFRVAYPVRSRHDDFVTRIYQYKDGITNRLFGTIGTRNLSGCIFQTVFFFQFLNNSIAQSRITRYRRVTRKVIIYGFFRSFFDVVRSIKIRFSYT